MVRGSLLERNVLRASSLSRRRFARVTEESTPIMRETKVIARKSRTITVRLNQPGILLPASMRMVCMALMFNLPHTTQPLRKGVSTVVV
jgi:hypothetical protein